MGAWNDGSMGGKVFVAQFDAMLSSLAIVCDCWNRSDVVYHVISEDLGVCER